jgi:hypothetical protein
LLLTAAFAFVGSMPCAVRSAVAVDNDARIRPYEKNPRYWQYKGQGVLLLGGSRDDNLFQIPNLKEHLDEIQAVGGNYIRNTMSARSDFGFEVQEFKKLPNGKYDLDQWNDAYWTRFENLLRWSHERDIIIQIEVWDRFDYSRDHWVASPWNPANNVNYTYEQTGFDAEYPAHPGQNKQPFFFSIPGMSLYTSKLDKVREYQQRRVAKMLSYSLEYPNVLYCMNNETSGPLEWGQHWMTFIRTKAAQRGVVVYATDMFDDVWTPQKSENLRLAINESKMYPFLDISQVNSRSYDDAHWNNVLWVSSQLEKSPRPMNNTKIYGSGYKTFGTGGPEDGVERFWRDILGGAAAARFHRPDSGNGLNDLAEASIRGARILESRIKFWEIAPHMELLSDREPNEAYLAAKPGERYALYFTNGGSVKLDLSRAAGALDITWISVSMGRVVETSASGGYRVMDKTIEGGRVVTLSAPYKGGWVAVLVKK